MKPTTSRNFRIIASSAVTVASLAACGGGGPPASPPPQAATQGTVAVAAMTDAPSCGLDAVYVSIGKIRFHQDANAESAANGWTDLSFSPAKRVNLLNPASVLSGVTSSLGEVALPVGVYTQLRVVLDGNAAGTANAVKANGAATETPLETAAVLASDGIKLSIDLRVETGGKTDLVVDFDACASTQRRGAAYVLKPLARAVPATLNGIAGYVDKAALGSGVVITAQQGGAIFTTTVPNPATGEFVLPRLAAGRYDVVVQATGRATAVIGAVPVDPASTVAVSTVAAPIPLAASTTSSISGQVTYAASKAAPDSGTWITATQTVNASTAVGNAATVVTYRFQPVDLGSGSYVLAGLPRSSLQYALYKPALPLTLANAATSLGNGRYRVEAVASGYARTTTTASANVNVGSANATGINIQLP
jgi:predicted small lipoprotein YifL